MENKTRTLIENLSLNDKAKLYYMALLKKGKIDKLPEDPKAAYVRDMMGKMEEGTDWKNITADLLGLIPGLGEPADLYNAIDYANKGDYLYSGLALVSMIPEYGDIAAKAIKIMVATGQLQNKMLKKIADGINKHWDKIEQMFDYIEEKAPDNKLKPHIPKIKNTLKLFVDEAKTASDLMIDKDGNFKPFTQGVDDTAKDLKTAMARKQQTQKDIKTGDNYVKDAGEKVASLFKETATELGYLNENDILQKIENGVNAISGGGRRHASVSDRGDKIRIKFSYMRDEFSDEEWGKIKTYITQMGLKILDDSNYYEANYDREEPAEAVPTIHLKK